MSEFSVEELIDNVKVEFLDDLLDKLQNDDCEVYFHDVGHDVVDNNVPNSISECAIIIDEHGAEYLDEGLISLDRGLLDGVLRPLAYDAIYGLIFNDDFFQYLQDKLNNENPQGKERKKLISDIQYTLNDKYDQNVDHIPICIECGKEIGENEEHDFTEDDQNVPNYQCSECMEKE